MEGVRKTLSTKSFTEEDLLDGINREVVPVLKETRTALNALAENVFAAVSGSATYDPGNLVDGAGVTTTVAVTGAALGDHAIASFSLDTQGVTLHAWVSAADVVSVRFQNETGGAINLASGTLRARVTAQ